MQFLLAVTKRATDGIIPGGQLQNDGKSKAIGNLLQLARVIDDERRWSLQAEREAQLVQAWLVM